MPTSPTAGVDTAGYAATPPAGIACRTPASGTFTLVCTVGYSVDGSPVEAVRQGSASACRLLLVLGQMHGEEWPGPLVVDRVRALPVPAGLQVWTVRTMNPDGGAAGQRYSAVGVDLNANFPTRWAPGAHSDAGALSEPEARAMARQFAAMVDVSPAEPVSCSGPRHGNLTDWYTATSARGGVAFTLEMPPASTGLRACRVPGYAGSRGVLDCVAHAAIAEGQRL